MNECHECGHATGHAEWCTTGRVANEEVIPDVLEGMFFSPHDIDLYRDMGAEQLSKHLNDYILQAYQIGKDSK